MIPLENSFQNLYPTLIWKLTNPPNRKLLTWLFLLEALIWMLLDVGQICLFPMVPHSSTLVWKIPWTEEPGRLQSMGSPKVGHDWATLLSLFTFMHWRRKWQPTPVFLPGESQGRGAWWAAVYGVTQSWTRLKWLRSSSSRIQDQSRFESKS